MRSFIRTPVILLIALAVGLPAAVLATPIDLSASGANGSGEVVQPGVPCADGGQGSSWTYGYTALLPGGAFSSLPTDLGLAIDLHSEVSAPDSAWLSPEGSSVTLANDRGTVALGLVAGSCESPVLSFDDTFALGAGTWAVSEGTGSYREATGSGSFTGLFSVGPGSDNPFTFGVNGQVDVLQPSLSVDVANASWMADTDPTSRVAAVTYRVTNEGPGDAFGVSLTGAGTSTGGVTGLGPTPQVIGAIPAGEHALVGVTYRFERGPCQLRDRGCALDADLALDLADALDVSLAPHGQTVRVVVPTAPGH